MVALFVLLQSKEKENVQETPTLFPPISTWLLAAIISSQITFSLNVELTSGLKLINWDEYWLRLLQQILGEEKRYKEWSTFRKVFSITFYDQGRVPSLLQETWPPTPWSSRKSLQSRNKSPTQLAEAPAPQQMVAVTCTDREFLQGFQQIIGKQKPRSKPPTPCGLVSTATSLQNKEFCTVYYFAQRCIAVAYRTIFIPCCLCFWKWLWERHQQFDKYSYFQAKSANNGQQFWV